VFGAGEDDSEAVPLLIFQMLKKKIFFRFLIDEADRLIDFFGGGLLGFD